jgi:hypothetical protein
MNVAPSTGINACGVSQQTGVASAKPDTTKQENSMTCRFIQVFVSSKMNTEARNDPEIIRALEIMRNVIDKLITRFVHWERAGALNVEIGAEELSSLPIRTEHSWPQGGVVRISITGRCDTPEGYYVTIAESNNEKRATLKMHASDVINIIDKGRVATYSCPAPAIDDIPF